MAINQSFHLLSYSVTQQLGYPYDIAELVFRGLDYPNKDEYIQIEQYNFDAPSGYHEYKKTIFRGSVKDVSRDLAKKGLETTKVRAYSNEWFLTQQRIPEADATTDIDINPSKYIDAWLNGGNVNQTDSGTGWEDATGVNPYLTYDIPNWNVSKEYEYFNHLDTTKYDAIMQFCNHFDAFFWCGYKGAFGKRYARFYTNIMGGGWNAYYPFNTVLGINSATAKNLLDVSITEHTALHTKVNRVKVAGGLKYDVDEDSYYSYEATKEHPLVMLGCRKPVEYIYKNEYINSSAEAYAYAENVYERLRESSLNGKVTLRSTVYNADKNTLTPGMNIKLTNVSGHNTSEYTITKIVQHKEGADEPLTEIHYSQVYDLLHPHVYPDNMISKIKDDVERDLEKGSFEPFSQQFGSGGRRVGLGGAPSVDIGKVVAKNTSLHTVDIRLINTSQLVKDVAYI